MRVTGSVDYDDLPDQFEKWVRGAQPTRTR